MIHITGTNGKTSTARTTESIVRAHGLRTGLMTSPHLVSIRERIVIDGQPIEPSRLVENWDDIAPVLELTDQELTAKGELPLTFFEALTVLALACFAEALVDVAVIEVGMGGEWDSTNVVQSQVAVFTPIAIDHAKQLGSTVAEIARTKSGIISRRPPWCRASRSPRHSSNSSVPPSSPSRPSRSRAPGSVSWT
ncbi:Mur ligase family protein [Sphingomonas sp. LR61]|uniref:bifunctional folylpolyglutamate synthase/dihydrofolate synthase n=1 Tax=Sphingomonas sp. LR61 TaxID=3050234 RepID=UPI002FE0BA15